MKGNQNAKKDISEEDLEKLKSDISNAFYETAEEFPVIALTEDNYNKYFPRGEMKTLIENVKIGENQLKKLKEKNREELTGSIIETLKNPMVIIEKRRDEEKR